MTTQKLREIQQMSKEEREKKLRELKLELMKSKSRASKTGSSKIREIKKIIARILTFNKSEETKDKLKIN